MSEFLNNIWLQMKRNWLFQPVIQFICTVTRPELFPDIWQRNVCKFIGTTSQAVYFCLILSNVNLNSLFTLVVYVKFLIVGITEVRVLSEYIMWLSLINNANIGLRIANLAAESVHRFFVSVECFGHLFGFSSRCWNYWIRWFLQ